MSAGEKPSLTGGEPLPVPARPPEPERPGLEPVAGAALVRLLEDVDAEDQLTDLLHQAFDLLVSGCFRVSWERPERVLAGGEELLLSALDLSDRQAMLTG